MTRPFKTRPAPRAPRLRAAVIAASICAAALTPIVQAAPDADMTASQAARQQATSADFARILRLMRADYLGASTSGAESAAAAVDGRGEWRDVDYGDRSAGDWKAIRHLERVRAMATLYAAKSESSGNGRAALKAAVVRALRAWLDRKPESTNWWHNTIGVQSQLLPVLVLMDGDLPQDLRAQLLDTLTDFNRVPADRKTGQNLVWYATQAIAKGALARSVAELNAGRDAVVSSLAFTDDEGLQRDLSFHQHMNQLYSGGYGLTYLSDVVRVAGWLKDSPWAMPTDSLQQLADFATLGIAPLVRGDWLDWGARGREVTRQDAQPRPVVLSGAVIKLADLLPTRREELTTLSARLQQGRPPATTSTVAYWRSDFLVHQSPKGYFSVKMVSKRTIGTESGVGENLLGYWLPFGTTFIVGAGNGAEYLGLQPLLDWSALPGVTAPNLVPNFNGYLKGTEDRVAVLGGAGYGLASMQVNTQGLQARKFWFVDGDMMVALGADIRYSGPQRVHTTINQTRWIGRGSSNVADLYPSTGDVTQSDVKWMTGGGVGYLMLDEQGATLVINERRLTGNDPTTTAFGARAATTKPTQIMTLSIDHGIRPQGASYAYAVLHGTSDAAQIKALPRPRVLINKAHAQGAASADGRRIAIAFHQPGEVPLGNGVMLQADQAIAVLAQVQGTQLQIQAIDLTGTGGSVELKTTHAGHTLDRKSVALAPNNQRSRQAPAASLTLLLPR